MSDKSSSKFLNRTLLTAGAALVLLGGAVAAPSLMGSRAANAQEIVVAPPSGAPMSFADLIERVRPAVVSIAVRQSPDAASPEGLDGLPPGFEEFFRGRPTRPGPAPTALGSGFFIDQSGIIVTNHHVIDGAEQITITTSDGSELPAELVGSDELTDIAVLRVTTPGRYPYVSFESDVPVRVGDWVVAVGNPFGLDGTATAGIVSAIGRRQGASNYVDFMQIDAPINRGNSGGPTFDLQGHVIGVNSAIFSPTGGNVGIGFAIPADTASRIVSQLLDGGRVTRGWLGVSIQTQMDEDLAHSLGLDEARGALIASVTDDSPAAQGGMQQGDLVVKFNGEDVEDSRDLTRRVGAAGVGETVRLEVLRGGRRRTLNVRLGERPSQQVLASAANPRQTPEGNSSGSAPSSESGTENALGVSVRAVSAAERDRYSLEANETGLVVTAMLPTSALTEKFVQPGDVILQAGGRPVASLEDLSSAVNDAKGADRPLLLQVQASNGLRRYLAVEIADE